MTTLVHSSDGRPVEKGEFVTCFRGDKYVIRGWRKPHKPSSTGRVYAGELDDKGNEIHGVEYFPSVFNMHWEDANG